MEIHHDKLTALLGESFDAGYSGCYELKQQMIEAILKKFQIRDVDEFRIWNVATLKEMPEGTIFQHISKGRCWIVRRANKIKYVQFQNGGPIELLTDTDPWNQPMRLIHKPE